MKNKYFIFYREKFVIVFCLILLVFNKLRGQNDFVPYLLENGRWTYVEKGSALPVLAEQLRFTTKFTKNGNAIIYDFDNITESVPGAFGGTVQRSRDIKVAYLVNNEFEILKKVPDLRLPGSSDFNDLIKPLFDLEMNFMFYSFLENNHRGIIDSTGKEIYPAKDFDNYLGISNGRIISYLIKNDSYQSGLLDLNGNIILPPSPIEFLDKKFSNGLIPYEVNDKCGYMDIDGNEVIFPQYKNCAPFNLGMAVVNYGTVINKQNKKIELGNFLKSLTGSQYIDYQFIEKRIDGDSPDSGFIAVIHHKSDYSILPQAEKNEEIILLDKNLKVINRLLLPRNPYDHSWSIISAFKNTIKLKNGSSYPSYYFWNFKNGAVEKQIDGGTVISEGRYQYLDKELGWGYKNLNQEIVIKPQFFECSSFKYGMAIVKNLQGRSIIDKNGKIILKLGNKYPDYDLEIVSSNFILCKDVKTYCYGLDGCKNFYIDLSGFEYRDNAENIAAKKEYEIKVQKAKDSIDQIASETEKARIINQEIKERERKIEIYTKALENVKSLSIGDIFEDGIILTKREDGSCLLITTESKVIDAKNLNSELSNKGKNWRMPTIEEAKLVREMKNNYPVFKKQFNKGSPGFFGIMSRDTKSNGFWMIGSTKALSGDEYFTTIPQQFWLVPVREYPIKDF